MNLLNIRKVGYGVRSIDELRSPGSRAEPQPAIAAPIVDPHRSILDDARFTSLPRQPHLLMIVLLWQRLIPKARSTSRTLSESSAVLERLGK